MYRRYLKRLLDFVGSLLSLTVLSPVLLLLCIIGAVVMKGNPFFTQERSGRKDRNGEETVFRLVKLRTMTNAKDENGRLLSDDERLTPYGRRLRSTSLDELFELVNILKGDMSFVGPRPLLLEYLPYYTKEERCRHDVRPGLTGLAQINGRNAIPSWESRFQYDLEYVRNYSFRLDLKIILITIKRVIRRSDILTGSEIAAGRLDDARRCRICASDHQTILQGRYPG